MKCLVVADYDLSPYTVPLLKSEFPALQVSPKPNILPGLVLGGAGHRGQSGIGALCDRSGRIEAFTKLAADIFAARSPICSLAGKPFPTGWDSLKELSGPEYRKAYEDNQQGKPEWPHGTPPAH